MSWLWPQRLNPHNSIVVRIGRVIHWAAIGLALLGAILSLTGLITGGETEPVGYVAIVCVWTAFAMIGRGIRYVIAKE